MNLLALFPEMQTALRETLTKEQQLFVSQHYPSFLDFIKTPQGTAAIQLFIEEWQKQKAPQ